MRFEFEVGEAEPHTVEFYWGQMLGSTRIKVDRKVIERRSMAPFSPTRLAGELEVPCEEKWSIGPIEIQLVEKWVFPVGIYEKHVVRIEKERSRVFAGLRPHRYRVFVDDRLVAKHEGY